MKKILYILFCMVLSLPQLASAQGSDPVLAGMIATNTSKAKKQYEKQEAAIAALGAQHMYMQKMEKHMTEMEDSLAEYLSTFYDYIVYAAEGYGFYIEIESLINNMADLSNQILAAPTNGVAVALVDRRNLYTTLLKKATGIVKTIRTLCMKDPKTGKASKMTQKERIALLLTIRPQLQSFNKDLRRLVVYVKYTSLNDVWLSLTHQHRPYERNIGAISRESITHWKANAKKAKIR